MSRYGVDKCLRAIMLASRSEREDFARDPDSWLGTVTDELTVEERAALQAFDVRALYGGGSHPFLLWMALSLTSDLPMPQLQAEYLQAVTPYGHPDYAT